MGKNIVTPSAPVTEIINRRQLQARLGISEGQAIKLDKRGILKSFRVGNCVRYDWKKVLEDLQKAGTSGNE